MCPFIYQLGAGFTAQSIFSYILSTDKIGGHQRPAGSHSHSVNPPNYTQDLKNTTSAGGHNHRWDYYSNMDYWSFTNSGVMTKITDWDNGLDNSGSGVYPLTRLNTSVMSHI